MACIRSKYSNDSSEDLYGITRPPPEIHHKTIIQIYTDWANHYLEKARCKRHIQDLQVDVTDGVILSDVVEAVTNQKVPDVIRKPKNSSQMVTFSSRVHMLMLKPCCFIRRKPSLAVWTTLSLQFYLGVHSCTDVSTKLEGHAGKTDLDNIHSCLVFLAGLGVSLEGITARDIRDGHLKSILSLFFQLSRYKQQQKQQDRDRHNLQKQSAEMQQTGMKTAGPKHAQDSSKLPPPFNKHAGNTSIPMPANASTPKKTPQEKGKSALGIGNGPHAFPCGNVKPASGSSSRSTSPSAVSGIPQSFIPTPRTSIPSAPSSARSSLHEKHISNAKNSGVQSKSSVRSQNNNSVSSVNLASSNHVVNSKANSSMLEKFKFFKEKDKGGDKIKNSAGSKRTSSSSGFSSARSERSDSSVSLSSETKAGSTEGPLVTNRDRDSGNLKSLVQQSSIVSPGVETIQSQNLVNNSASTPRLAIKGFRQKIGKAISSKESKVSHSPKSSRKESLVDSSSATAKGSQPIVKVQSGKLDSHGGSSVPAVSGKDVPSSGTTQFENSLPGRKLEKDRDKQGRIETKLRNPRQGMDSGVNSSDSSVGSSNTNSAGYSFMRQAKPNGVASSSRESKNRFSGTGIPTRNSLIVTSNNLSNVNGNSNSKDEVSGNNPQMDVVANTNNINASMSSMNGLVGNGTGIPKPTAAVKGTTKMTVTKEVKETIPTSAQPSNANLVSKDCVNNSKASPNAKIPNNKVSSSTVPSVSSNGVSNSSFCTSQVLSSSSASNENVTVGFGAEGTPVDSSPKKPNKNEMVPNGVSIAMVSPMPSVSSSSVCGSGSSSNVITSMSSTDSPLSQSNSNSSEASVILLKGKLVNFDKSRNSEDATKESNDALPMAPNQSNANGNKTFSNDSSSVSSMSKSDSSTSPCTNDDALNLNSMKSSSGVIVECEEDELMVNVMPMEPLLRNSPYGYIKTPSVSSGFLSPKSPNANHPPLNRIAPHREGSNNSSRVLNSITNRHVYNPYCDPVRLVVRRQQVAPNKYASSHYSSTPGDYDYTEIDNVDISGTGYLSDGDLLMSGNNGNRPSDGYLSESGASIYSRRIHQSQRSKETQGGSNKHALITEDSFDDSSSLSSGISDLNEIPTDLTSSSVNSELSSPYASLQRAPAEILAKKELVDPQSIIYRVVGSRSGNASKKQGSHIESQSEINSSIKNQIVRSSTSSIPADRKDSNGHHAAVESHHYQQNLRSEVNGKVLVRDKHGSLASSSQILHHSSNGIQSGALSSLFSPQQTTSNGKRHDAKTMNNSDPKKRGMMGMKEEYYGKEMADRLIKEERDRESKDRHRNSSGHGHNSHNGHKGNSNICADGKRSNSVKVAPTSYGYVRRSNGSGNCIVTKYSISPCGKVSSEGRSEKELLTAEEYKAAQVSLLSRLDSKGNEMHPNSFMGSGMGGSAVTASPKTRTKVKISGGTQTTNDLHEMNRHHSHNHPTQSPQSHHHPYHHQQQQYQMQQHGTSDAEYASSTCSRNSGSFSSQSHNQPGYKSLSLTTPTATQLSQSLRERILGSQSLPKAATSSADYAAILAAIQQQQQHQHQQIYGTPNASKERMSRYNKVMNDGSLSDTGGYSNYSEIQAFANVNSTMGSPYSWMRHSTGYASSITSAPNRLISGGSMTEAESLESLSSTSSMAAQLRDVRSNSLTQGRISNHQHETSPSRSPRLNRSNSIRSTKSEKLYPSMLQRSDDVNQYYSTQLPSGIGNIPTSPMHSTSSRLAGGGQGPYSSTPASNHSVRLSMSPYSGFLAKIATKEDEINGSSLSLVSTASSIYSSQEERQAHEIRKLKRELGEAQEKVQTLTNQLSTNAHVVAAFEQSLSNMTQRLQSLSASAEQKDSEVTELRKTIELLRKQSIEAGLTAVNFNGGASRDGSPIGRQLSADSVSSINSISSACSGTSHSHTSGPSGQVLMTPLGTPTHHGTNVAPDSPNSKKKHNKNKGWLRSSFTKAFSRSKANKNRNMSPSDVGGEDCLQRPSNLNGSGGDGLHMNGHYHPHHNLRRNLDDSAPGSPTLTSPHGLNTHGSCLSNGCSSSSGSHSPRSNGHVKGSGSSSGLCEDFGEENASVDDLKKQLREKEMVLTDIRLEALTSAHQLESFKETVNKMRSEMLSLKQDNERLQRMVSSKSLTSSQTSLQLQSLENIDRRLSASEVPGSSSIDALLVDGNEKDGKRITITAFLGCHGSPQRYLNASEEFPASECTIGNVLISTKIKWDTLDSMVKKAFKEYVMRVDPVTNLGLNADSIGSYRIGEITRSKESVQPDLLPCGYLVGDVNKIQICLRGAASGGSLDALAFETLIPKSILQRYISLLLDHGRMILCGPSGTGKSYLARKLGEFIVARSGKDLCPEAIATFSADHKNSKELRQYLTNLAEQCESSSADLPSVIILDNLHQISSFGEVFNGFLNSKQPSSPIIIGTMGQSSSTCANLPLHHNFRWVLFGNHMDPVKGFLSRYLQRRLIEFEVQNGVRSVELGRVIEWIPKVWHHVNKFLEIYNSADATIGPRIFLSCPTDVANSQVWFTDLWHYSIVPYLIEAVKEGIQIYGKKAAWEDPTHFLMQTYPWTESRTFTSGKSPLQSVRAEDVGYNKGQNSTENKTSKPESNDTDPLMNMLMRLQEAANYSGPQSNDSDATSLDSHSLDSKDYTAAA